MNPLYRKSVIVRLLALAILPAATAQAVVNITTTFSTAEGYIAGGIDDDDNPGNQSDDWQRVNSASATSFVVGPPGVTVNPLSAGISAQAVYQTPLNFTEGAVTTFTDFAFSQTTVATRNQTVLGMAYLHTATSGNSAPTSGLFGVTNGGYRVSWGNTDTAITQAELGLNLGASDTQSDNLRLSMTLTRTDTLNTWSRVITLTNLTTDTIIASVASSTFTDPTPPGGSPTLYDDTALHVSMTSSFSTVVGSESEYTGLTISQFGISQVPEPTAAALSLAGALLLLRRRR